MTETKPLRIGLSAALAHPDDERPLFKGKRLVYAEESMFHWVMGQGALPFLLPPRPPAGLGVQDLVDAIDALILTGGADVAPAAYGEVPMRPEWSGDPIRDGVERALIDAVLAAGKPLFGVCRGLQIINVALGGSLLQDIEMQHPNAKRHRDWGVYDGNCHGVLIERTSGLARLFPGVASAEVNSIHHQAIKELAPGLCVEARSADDGIIEAVRFKGGAAEPWIFAVQWHPEWHDRRAAELLPGAPLLADFLQAARRRRG